MSDIVWQDPPKDARSGENVVFRDALRANPGKWALHHSRAAGMATRIKKSQTAWLGFDAVTRKRDDGEGFDIYVRYVGDDQ